MIRFLAGSAPLLILLLAGLNAFSQIVSFHVKGRITNEFQKPLPSATVILLNSQNKEITKASADANGNFDLACPPKGDYKLSISFTGYQTYQSALFKHENKDLGTIQLIPAENRLAEVVVPAKQNLVELDGGSIVYNVNKSIDAQGVTALGALKKAPGVFVDNDNTITLNGKQGALILLDGKQTYMSGKELTDLLRSMPSSGIRSIEIINSPSAKYDAAGSAGIINIKTIKSQIKGFNGNLTTGISYGTNLRQNQDISLNYPKNNYNIYGGYNHFLGNYTYLYGSDRIQNDQPTIALQMTRINDSACRAD